MTAKTHLFQTLKSIKSFSKNTHFSVFLFHKQHFKHFFDISYIYLCNKSLFDVLFSVQTFRTSTNRTTAVNGSCRYGVISGQPVEVSSSSSSSSSGSCVLTDKLTPVPRRHRIRRKILLQQSSTQHQPSMHPLGSAVNDAEI